MFSPPGILAQSATPTLDGFPLADGLAGVAHKVPGALVSSAAMQRLCEAARSTPLRWHWGMVEVRLGREPAPQIDLLACLFRQAVDLPREAWSAIAESSALSHTIPLLTAWSHGSPTILHQVPTVWFEWDQGRGTRAPLLWECVDPHFFGAPQLAADAHHVVEASEAFFSASAAYRVAGAAQTLSRVTAALPEGGARVVAVASMEPRGLAAYRLYVRTQRHQVLPWLERIGWPGDLDRVRQVADIINPRFEPAYCQIEIDHDVRPYLAVELGQTERNFPERASRARFLGRLVARGVVDEEKADAVLGWDGEEDVTIGGQGKRLVRNHHLKLVLEPDGRSAAKAYLGFYALSA